MSPVRPIIKRLFASISLWVIVTFVLWACAPIAQVEVASPPTRAAGFATISAPVARATLPPSWTPSFTPPPTATFTVTPTLTSVPTLSSDEICTGFNVIDEPQEAQAFAWNSAIPIIAGVDARDVVIRFLAVHRETGENKGFQVPGGQMSVGQFPIRLLPHPGLYDWTLSVFSEQYGDVCIHEGTFMALDPEDDLPGTPSEAEN